MNGDADRLCRSPAPNVILCNASAADNQVVITPPSAEWKLALPSCSKVKTVEFFKCLNQRFHQGTIEVISIRFFMRALVQVGPHKIGDRNTENSTVGSQQKRFINVGKS